MSLAAGAATFYKYFRPRQEIDKIANDFWASVCDDGPVVGVHFRGLDHSEEAPRVSYEHCVSILQNHLRTHEAGRAVFVASDEQAFIDFLKEKMKKSVPIYSRDDHYRSSDNHNLPVFRRDIGKGGYEKGEDALVNCLLLSKCSTLIRTTSCLSAWASVFNSNLRVVLLNKPYENKLWYPESEVIARKDTTYFPEIG